MNSDSVIKNPLNNKNPRWHAAYRLAQRASRTIPGNNVRLSKKIRIGIIDASTT
jgi:hypothetical protein